MMYSLYYQAVVDRQKTWLIVGSLRSHEGLCFDRALDKHKNLFEFFVPASSEKEFVAFMTYFSEQGLVESFQKLPNRLEQGEPFNGVRH